MNIKINNKDFRYYDNLVVNLRYNAVASSFSFGVVFNPDDADHRAMFRPGAFPDVVVQHEGETLITGTLWPVQTELESVKKLMGIAGYSKTGHLQDSTIPKEAFPVQYDGLSLKQIAEKLIKPFGISLVVDAAVATLANGAYDTSSASNTSGVAAYIAELAAQKNIILTHDELGRLHLTKAPAKQLPVFDFTDGQPGVTFTSGFDGQQLHSHITVRGQAGIDGGNARQHTVTNPYVTTVYRPLSVQQSSGTDNDTALAARNKLAAELRAIRFTVNMQGWTLAGKVVRPGMVVSITSPENQLYNKTNFFIEQVDLAGDAATETATLTCVLPEVYNGGTPKNIFA